MEKATVPTEDVWNDSDAEFEQHMWSRTFSKMAEQYKNVRI
jgi:hypothetical protein